MANANRYRTLRAIKKIREAQGFPTDQDLELELEAAREEVDALFTAQQEAMKAAYLAYWMERREQQRNRKKTERRPLQGIKTRVLLNAFGLTWADVKTWAPLDDLPRILRWAPESLLPRMEEDEAHEVMDQVRRLVQEENAGHVTSRQVSRWEKKVEKVRQQLTDQKAYLDELIQHKQLMEKDQSAAFLTAKQHAIWVRATSRLRIHAKRQETRLRAQLRREKLQIEIARVRQERLTHLGGVMEQVMRMRASEEQAMRQRMLEAEQEKSREAAREEALIRLLSAPEE